MNNSLNNNYSVNPITVPFVNLGEQYLQFKDEILSAIDQLSQQGQYIFGQQVTDFEEGLAKVCQTKYAIAVANGTDALSLILKGLNIGYGDEVITAPNSFIASAGAIADVGATPVFADVDNDFNLSPKKIEQAITAKTKAIIVVHLTGNPARMDEINALAKVHHIEVIEDAAQAIGAQYQGRRIGGLAKAAAFSLHPLKNFHLMGDAGFITTNDEKLYQHIKQRQNHGLIDRNESTFWGQNSRLDAIQAAIGNIKLPSFDNITERFCQIGQFYLSELKGVVQCPVISIEDKAVFHNFIIQVPNRDHVLQQLALLGVECKIHYPIPLHLMRCSASLGYKKGDFPVTERQSEQILSLPIYPELTQEQLEHIVAAVKTVVHAAAKETT